MSNENLTLSSAPPTPSKDLLKPPRFGLYLHVPLCLSKCPYCDFVSFPLDRLGRRGVEEITAALHRELELVLKTRRDLKNRALDTVYFGGGTPSLLEADAVADLIAHALSAFSPASRPREITLECNPLAAESSRLAAFHRAGVNRVSLGVQSFHAETLKMLGRRHSAREALEACRRIREIGFDSWGLDLIFGAPRPRGERGGVEEEKSPENLPLDPDLERFGADLGEALSLDPPHLSIYGLTVHEGTEMAARQGRGELVFPGEEAQREMFLLARRTLVAAGRRHYEISNYAIEGHESRHNRLYWTGGEYLGLGVGAHSCLEGRRFANPANLEDYFERLREGRWPAEAEAAPSPRSRRAECIMLALRQCDGADTAELSRRLECDFSSEYREEIARLTERGLLECPAETVRLTEEGLLLSDRVFEEFF